MLGKDHILMGGLRDAVGKRANWEKIKSLEGSDLTWRSVIVWWRWKEREEEKRYAHLQLVLWMGWMSRDIRGWAG